MAGLEYAFDYALNMAIKESLKDQEELALIRARKESVEHERKIISHYKSLFDQNRRDKYEKYLVRNFIFYLGEDDIQIAWRSDYHLCLKHPLNYIESHQHIIPMSDVLNEGITNKYNRNVNKGIINFDQVFKSLELHESILLTLFIPDITNLIMPYISDVYMIG